MGTIQAFAEPLTGYKDKNFLLRHLEETRDEFLTAIAGLTEAQWRFKPAADRWSIGECAEHVTLAETFIRARVQDAMNTPEATAAEKEKANLTDEEWIRRVTDRSGKRPSPPALEPTGRWSSATEIDTIFREGRQATLAYAKAIPEAELRKHLQEAPSGTVLDAYQWMALLSAHSRRHTLQIEEVKATTDYPSGSSPLSIERKAIMQARVVSHDEWVATRKQFLAREKELTRLRDDLARQRQQLPWERVEKKYNFEGVDGKRTLGELFGGQSQLIVYHFMLGPGWPEGCPSCSFLSDQFDALRPHMIARDVNLVAISRAPWREIAQFKERMGWQFPWYSSSGTDFNPDFGVSFSKEQFESGKMQYNYEVQQFPSEEAPGASVFAKNEAGEVFHTYSTYGRGLDMMLNAYNFIDLTPKGRNEEGLPWPMAWVRHHDKYEHAEDGKACCH